MLRQPQVRNFNSIPADMSQYSRGAGDMSNDTIRMNQLNPNSPDYQRHLFEIMARNLEILGSMRIINRGITTRKVAVTSTPTLVMGSTVPSAITIINPTPAVGLTTDLVLYPAGTVLSANGNSQAVPIYCSNYDSVHMYVSITNIGGAPLVDMYMQTKNPQTGNWVDIQAISPPGGFAANGEYYSFFSGFGVNGQVALRWEATGVWGSVTLGIGYTLKIGLGGSNTGSSNTVYIGSAGVTRFGGYPIFEGQYRDFNMRENVDLFAVSGGADVDVNIIEFN